MSDEVTITPVDPTYSSDQTLRELNRERDFIVRAAKEAEAQNESFANEKTTFTVTDIINQLKASIMMNTIMSVIVGIIPGLLDYIQTNGLSWKSIGLGVIAGILAFFSPSPEKKEAN